MLIARVTYIVVPVRKLLGAGALVLQQVMGTAVPEQRRTKHSQPARLVSKPLLGSGAPPRTATQHKKGHLWWLQESAPTVLRCLTSS